jgi:beta-glucanase (GH16 family)
MSPIWARRISSGLAVAFLFGGAVVRLPPGGASDAAEAQQALKPVFRATVGQPPGSSFFADLRQGFDKSTEYVSDFDLKEDWVRTSFRNKNVVFHSTGMRLLAEKPDVKGGPFTAGEFQRRGFYGYGRYEVVMRSSGVSGVVSSFFTHTNNQFGDPHTEIDFEFFGKSPWEVHLNYYVNGQDNPENVALWFDASRAEHLYAFEWGPEYIRWYVDGLKVREIISETSPVGIPANSSRVIANIWTGSGNSEEWVGTPEFERTSAFYTCMSHVAAGQAGKQCSDVFSPPDE